jgi:hypothetical protein
MIGSILFLLPEIHTGIDAQCTKGIGNTKIRPAVVITIENQHGTRKVFSIIIYDRGTRDEIKIEVLCPVSIR